PAKPPALSSFSGDRRNHTHTLAPSLLLLRRNHHRNSFIPHAPAVCRHQKGSSSFPFLSPQGPSDVTSTGTSDQSGLDRDKDGAYVCDPLNSVHMVTNVMETLVKRVLIAESETAIEKEKVNFGKEEIKKKENQLENMSLKLEEMERFAFGTNCILSELRQRVKDFVDETSRQRQRAAENEHELSRVRDFESLKSYVSSLISVRETLISSEKQFQTIEKLFERWIVHF
ncbi:uncharacterized protein, partial [Spinacia oleracea]|uniref:Uncharacterized protein n=1 Tax=Spinacia oleracea TaxID=3562 RepID=A0ABM3RS29_SPIOL